MENNEHEKPTTDIDATNKREEELAWMTKKFSWRYIPLRYQANVAMISAGLLYFNIVNILFQPTAGPAGACGSLLRPVYGDGDIRIPGWIWTSNPFTVNNDLMCARHIYGLWWQLMGSFAALAICGLVMRRAIKRTA